MSIDYLERILNARVYDVAVETPLEEMTSLSARLNNKILLKREDVQSVFSFKLRGAYNKMAQLPREVLARGVICASAGNHAQGVALAAQKMGIRAVIVMPMTTPRIKVDAVRRRGGEVVLSGESFDEAYAQARILEAAEGLSFVHPYDDPDVIAGQGTIGMEILRQCADPIDAIFCGVGGGGLITGVAAYVKRLRPNTLVIGVEAEDADAMAQSLEVGHRIKLEHVGLFADGAAVKQVGEETFRLAQQYVNAVIRVSNDEICAAIKDGFENTRSIFEPAGALGLAGAKKWITQNNYHDKTVIVIASGANMNFDRLRFVAERVGVGEQNEAILAVTLPEKPGSFKALCRLFGQHNITEFNYRYSDRKEAHVFVGIQVANRDEVKNIVATLEQNNLQTLDLTDNEMAKLHVRHMVGGHANAQNELIYSFIFPERPGALSKFLDAMHSNWNISLFHYRNHGADYGRVLVGVQVPPSERAAFDASLQDLGYEYIDESKNPICKIFLQ